jgi:hypothetical protein
MIATGGYVGSPEQRDRVIREYRLNLVHSRTMQVSLESRIRELRRSISAPVNSPMYKKERRHSK